jgi:hypothetical protein
VVPDRKTALVGSVGLLVVAEPLPRSARTLTRAPVVGNLRGVSASPIVCIPR